MIPSVITNIKVMILLCSIYKDEGLCVYSVMNVLVFTLKADSYLHAARSTQHAARSTQYAARSTQHAARINFNSYFHLQIMRAHDQIYCFQWESWNMLYSGIFIRAGCCVLRAACCVLVLRAPCKCESNKGIH